ncbi:DUF3820 family protein [Ascidiimonas aurantiaca]|uniref:DUF3820 family protein n=1 Tax=Ascidiimonas aurantiaca TaxID=1685432 RepID=UPI0030EE340C
MDLLSQNKEFLVKLAHYKMPFGKYKDRYLSDLPEAYLNWFAQKGFPKGNLGMMLQAMHEIKINGLEPLISRIRKEYR